MKKYVFLSVLFSVFLCQTATADFYKWVDEKGEIQITDYPPPENKAVKNIEIHEVGSEDPLNAEGEDDASKAKNQKKPEIVLYTKNNCPDCEKAKEFLNSKNVPFIEYNMDTDEKAVAKRKEVDQGDEVPFAIINRNQVYGFSESVYNKVLQMQP
ncbi:MAG TPA: glutaredoxin family protein [Smithella sp.]|jgi:glutaredoxin|nr:glutaredoxin family protein [Smithella sp.]NMC96903.1 glutaredoxin family protein [Deltaproteobacteria bacterium]HOE33341.1 glutaredoxin family protein [Smithella sp.]HOG10901.1 glutaredoxin family protein [Smithella sp.]HOO36421.1 glutaredoxin family protein [Smithella sp.]